MWSARQRIYLVDHTLLRQPPPHVCCGFAVHGVLHSFGVLASAKPLVSPAQHCPWNCSPAKANPSLAANATQVSIVAPEGISATGNARRASSTQQP